MLNIFKSTNPDTLVNYFAARLSTAEGDIFSDHRLIVPSMTISDWLVNKLADRLGICAQIRPLFWGEFAWKLAEDITGDAEPGGYAPLSAVAMQWQLFSDFCTRETQANTSHNPVIELLSAIPTDSNQDNFKKYRLISEQLAAIFVRYLSLRPHWLWLWSHGQGEEVKEILTDLKNWQDLPPWMQAHLETVIQAQRYLWQQHFAKPFLRRCLRQEMFWQILEENYPQASLDKPFFGQRLPAKTLNTLLQNPDFDSYWQRLKQNATRRQAALPNHLFVYGIEGVTKDQWHFLADLSRFCTIDVFHQVITPAYFLDMVDEKMLKRQQLISPKETRESIHPILSRLGKQQKSTARLLAESEDFITTHDIDFINFYDDLDQEDIPAITLLETLQKELRELNHELIAEARPVDCSIEVHGCHGLMRQLEILRGELAHSLNQNPQLELSDILIVMPEVAKYQAVIRAIFPPNGNYDGYYLPARITGVTSPAAQNLWEALSGIYCLAKTRFDSSSICDWLLSDDVCLMLGVSYAAMERITEALLVAGFRRGFDKSTLSADDEDERFTFCYALDRLCAGLLLPDSPCYGEKIIPYIGLSLDDANAINALCRLANRWRYLLSEEVIQPIDNWINMLQKQLANDFEHAMGSSAYVTVAKTLAELAGQLEALTRESDQPSPKVPLSFVLDDISKHLAAQQSSSEPSGVITIGRLGAMRGLPYKLIAFVNFNIDEFPALRQDDRYDLITLDREQAGDRKREHEDLGALLETICNAGERVLFFYNRFRDDGEEQLPSAPVQELLQYLSDKMGYQSEDNPLHILQQSDPFHPDQSRARPAPLWHKVALTLVKESKQPAPFITPILPPQLPPMPKVEKQISLKFSYFIRGLQNPAEHYLKMQNIQIKQEKNSPPPFEPLLLNHLENYLLNQYLIEHIDARGFDPLPFLPLYPIGLAGKNCLQQKREAINQRQAKLLTMTDSARFPELSEQIISIAGINLSITLPVEKTCPWLQMSASKAKGKYLLKQWIAHLLRHLSGGKGETICAYNDKIVTFAAIEDKQQAEALFNLWLQVWYYSGTALWALPIDIPLKCTDGNFLPVVKDWIKEIEKNQYDDNQAWLFVLKNQDNKIEILTRFAEKYADILYQPLFKHLSEQKL